MDSLQADREHTSIIPVWTTVVVCFRSGSQLPACLDLIEGRTKDAANETIVINNSTDDQAEIERICSTRNVSCIQNETNIGYGRACNIGARNATGRYILFLNPDVRISKASVDILVKLAEANKDLVGIGPLHGNSNGKIRSKRSTVGQLKSSGNRPLRALLPSDKLTQTSFLSGGAILVRKDAFDSIGGFDG